MQLCLMIEGQEGVTWPQWRAIAGACEEHGITTLFRSDHYVGQHRGGGSLDAWATLSALAAVTSSLRLGTLVSPATFRHPSLLAKVVLTADHVSGGRVELGLGAGWHEREHDAYGFPFPPLRTRMEMLAEQLEVVLANWSEGPFSFAGEHYTLHDLEAEPPPVQRPHPPLIIGGYAGPRSTELAARFADEYNTIFPTLEDVRRRRERIEEACERAGRPPLPLSVMTGVVVGADEADLRQRLERLCQIRGGSPAELMAEPPTGWIVGTTARAVEQLAALRDAGVSRVMCQHLLHEDLEAIELLGREVAPHVA